MSSEARNLYGNSRPPVRIESKVADPPISILDAGYGHGLETRKEPQIAQMSADSLIGFLHLGQFSIRTSSPSTLVPFHS